MASLALWPRLQPACYSYKHLNFFKPTFLANPLMVPLLHDSWAMEDCRSHLIRDFKSRNLRLGLMVMDLARLTTQRLETWAKVPIFWDWLAIGQIGTRCKIGPIIFRRNFICEAMTNNRISFFFKNFHPNLKENPRESLQCASQSWHNLLTPPRTSPILIEIHLNFPWQFVNLYDLLRALAKDPQQPFLSLDTKLNI